MRTLLTSQTRHLLPVASSEYREDVFFSPQDVSSCGVGTGDYAILRVLNVIPEGPAKKEAVRINEDSETPPQPNSLKINSAFLEELRFSPGQEWELSRADDLQPMLELTLEPSPLHCFSKEKLTRLRRGAFDGRCFYVVAGGAVEDLSLRVDKQKLFRVRESSPSYLDLMGPTVLCIVPDTRITIYSPGRQGGTDLVLILDVSESMKLKDFEERKGQVVTRMDAACGIVKQILEWHSSGGASGSRFALVTFGRDARAAYPEGLEALDEITPYQADALCRKIPNLKNSVDITGSDIIGAINAGAKLLNNTSGRDNKKTFILVSDGAFWSGRRKKGDQYINQKRAELDIIVEFISGFYEETGICIHTVTVGNEDWTYKFERESYNADIARPEGKRGHIPNPVLLGRIAQLTNGKSITAQNIGDLRELFEERPEGTIVNLLK